MVQLVRSCCIAVVLMGVVSASAQAGNIKVFLLGGQSNMDGRADDAGLPLALQSPQADVQFYEGGNLRTLRPGSGSDFGPEITFGRTIADALPDESFALIKYAVGGTDLNNDWDPTTGTQYESFTDTVTNGLAALNNAGHTNIEIVGMLWTQGERDGKYGRTTEQYQADLNELIASIRGSYGANLPFYLSRLSSSQTDVPTAGRHAIRTAQENVATADTDAYMIDTDSFSVSGDNLHFDAAGQIALGEAFGQAYLSTTPEPGSLVLMGLGYLLVMRRRCR